MEKILIINENENLSENLETNLDSEEQLIETVKKSLQHRDNYIVSRKENTSSLKETKKKKMGSHNPNSRIHLHRPSVRSISETPNVIGASRIRYTNDACTYLLIGFTWLLVIFFFPLSFLFIFRVVQEYERGKFDFSYYNCLFFKLIYIF